MSLITLWDVGNAIVNIVMAGFWALLSLLNSLLLGMVTIIWQYAFGLMKPDNAFPTFPYTNVPPPNQFYVGSPVNGDFTSVTIQNFATVSANWALFFIDDLVIPILSIMIVIYGILYAFDVLRGKGESIFDSLPKIVFGIVLAFTSIMLASLLMEFGQALYNILWTGVNFNGTYLRGLNQLQESPLPNVNFGLVIKISSDSLTIFILLFLLITTLISFLLMLAVRLIWIFTSVILLPIASILYPFKYFEDTGKKLWVNFIEKGFDLFLMAIPLLFLPWITGGSINLGTFGSSSGANAEMTIIILIAILTVSMGLPYFLSRVGAPGYPNPSKLLQNAGATALQTGMQAGMVAFAVGTMGTGAFLGGLKGGMSLLPNLSGSGTGTAVTQGGAGLGQAGAQGMGGAGLGPAMPLGQAGQVGQAGKAGGKGSFWGDMIHYGKTGMGSHFPHIKKSLEGKDFTGLAGHSAGAVHSGVMGVTGYLLGRAIGAVANKLALRKLSNVLAKNPGKLLEPKKLGQPILNRAKDMVHSNTLNARIHFNERGIDYLKTPKDERNSVYNTFVDEANNIKSNLNKKASGLGDYIYNNVAKDLSQKNEIARLYKENNGGKIA
jgi:hypothetical protein